MVRPGNSFAAHDQGIDRVWMVRDFSGNRLGAMAIGRPIAYIRRVLVLCPTGWWTAHSQRAYTEVNGTLLWIDEGARRDVA